MTIRALFEPYQMRIKSTSNEDQTRIRCGSNEDQTRIRTAFEGLKQTWGKYFEVLNLVLICNKRLLTISPILKFVKKVYSNFFD